MTKAKTQRSWREHPSGYAPNTPLGGLEQTLYESANLLEEFWFSGFGNPKTLHECCDDDDKSWRAVAREYSRRWEQTAQFLEQQNSPPWLIDQLRDLSRQMAEVAKSPTPDYWE